MKKQLISLALFVILFSCKSESQQKLINQPGTLWKVSHTAKLLDSSLRFYRFHAKKFDEVISYIYDEKKYDVIELDPDIPERHAWSIINDSIFKFAQSDFRVLVLNDSIGVFQNLKKLSDTMFLKKIRTN